MKPLQSLTLIFGIILKGFNNKVPKTEKSLGELSSYQTKDGTFSLKSSRFKEAFHSQAGALYESKNKFIFPSHIERFNPNKELFVLDVCVGLGYNLGSLLKESMTRSININWWGLELDKRPLVLALRQKNFTNIWSPLINQILKRIESQSEWVSKSSKGKILWGDARATVSLIPKTIKFDLIYLDAFSPMQCPELWSIEFLTALTRKIKPGGRLITYSRSAAVRRSLRIAGMELKSLLPIKGELKGWSSGTVAILPECNKNNIKNSPKWASLSQMEEEHLLTRASIPFRDPNGNKNSQEILSDRIKEQSCSSLESTSSWQRRWWPCQ